LVQKVEVNVPCFPARIQGFLKSESSFPSVTLLNHHQSRDHRGTTLLNLC